MNKGEIGGDYEFSSKPLCKQKIEDSVKHTITSCQCYPLILNLTSNDL